MDLDVVRSFGEVGDKIRRGVFNALISAERGRQTREDGIHLRHGDFC
jgi:hypothetical protein